jgi:hypothetical protein
MIDTYPFRNMPKNTKITDYDLTLVAAAVIIFVLGIVIGVVIF